MGELVKQSYQIVELAVIDHGDFCFRSQYQHLVVSQDCWFRMIPKQRQNNLCDVLLLTTKSEKPRESLPMLDLQGIWHKAEQLQSPNRKRDATVHNINRVHCAYIH